MKNKSLFLSISILTLLLFFYCGGDEEGESVIYAPANTSSLSSPTTTLETTTTTIILSPDITSYEHYGPVPVNVSCQSGQNKITVNWECDKNKNSSLKIFWNDIPEAKYYKVYRSLNNNYYGDVIGTTTQPEYFDVTTKVLSLSSNTAYYTITAVDENDIESEKGKKKALIHSSHEIEGYAVYRNVHHYIRINPTFVAPDVNTFDDIGLPSDKEFQYEVSTIYRIGGTSYETPYSELVRGTTNPADHQEMYVSFNVWNVDTVNNRVTYLVNVYDQYGDVIKGLNISDFDVSMSSSSLSLTGVSSVPTSKVLSGAITLDYSDSMSSHMRIIEYSVSSSMVQRKKTNDEYYVMKYSTFPLKTLNYTNITNTIIDFLIKKESLYGKTAIYDSNYEAITDLLPRSSDHRKVLLIFTDGCDGSSDEYTLEDLIQYAQENNVPIYNTGYNNSVHNFACNSGPEERGELILMQMSEETGGAKCTADYNTTGIFELVQDQLDNGYLVTTESPVVSGSASVTVTATHSATGLTDTETHPAYFN